MVGPSYNLPSREVAVVLMLVREAVKCCDGALRLLRSYFPSSVDREAFEEPSHHQHSPSNLRTIRRLTMGIVSLPLRQNFRKEGHCGAVSDNDAPQPLRMARNFPSHSDGNPCFVVLKELVFLVFLAGAQTFMGIVV